MRARIQGILLGVAVFAAALAVWEALARRSGSFYFRPVSEVAERAIAGNGEDGEHRWRAPHQRRSETL